MNTPSIIEMRSFALAVAERIAHDIEEGTPVDPVLALEVYKDAIRYGFDEECARLIEILENHIDTCTPTRASPAT